MTSDTDPDDLQFLAFSERMKTYFEVEKEDFAQGIIRTLKNARYQLVGEGEIAEKVMDMQDPLTRENQEAVELDNQQRLSHFLDSLFEDMEEKADVDNSSSIESQIQDMRDMEPETSRTDSVKDGSDNLVPNVIDHANSSQISGVQLEEQSRMEDEGEGDYKSAEDPDVQMDKADIAVTDRSGRQEIERTIIQLTQPMVDLADELRTTFFYCYLPPQYEPEPATEENTPNLEFEIVEELAGTTFLTLHLLLKPMFETQPLKELFSSLPLLYRNTIAPTLTECVVTGDESKYLCPLMASCDANERAKLLIPLFSQLAEKIGDEFQRLRPEVDSEYYKENAEKVIQQIDAFCKDHKERVFNEGVKFLTDHLNSRLIKLRETISGFDVRRMYEQRMVSQYLLSGNEEDLDDEIMENHCKVLVNVYREVFTPEGKFHLSSILKDFDFDLLFGDDKTLSSSSESLTSDIDL